ncbi:MAG: acetate--CoA ligase family protein [Deltaproteobacteria bacterium]|nr:MAG: acetate--CoA ligase family protein [Deltaproteobacteria bacterium]
MKGNSEIKQIFDAVRQEGRARLTEGEAKRVLASAGLAITREDLASSEDEAVTKAEQIGFPVVL